MKMIEAYPPFSKLADLDDTGQRDRAGALSDHALQRLERGKRKNRFGCVWQCPQAGRFDSKSVFGTKQGGAAAQTQRKNCIAARR